MVICKFYMQGTCKHNENCKFDHDINDGGLRKPQMLINPSAQQGKGAPVDTNALVKSVLTDMINTEKGGQWLLSSYAPFKDKVAFPGFIDESFEEIRMLYYEAKNAGTLDKYYQELQAKFQDMIGKIRLLQQPSNEIIGMLVQIYNTPSISTTTGGGGSGQSSSGTFSNAGLVTAPVVATSVNPFASSANQSWAGASQSSQPTTNSIFGANSVFSAQQSTPSSTNIFANASANKSSFSAPSNSQNVFGNSLFSATTNKSSTTSIFGGGNSQSSNTAFAGGNTSIFSNNPNQSVSGSSNFIFSTNNNNFGSFGGQTNATGIFANALQQTTYANQPGNVFNNNPQQPQSVFNNPQSVSNGSPFAAKSPFANPQTAANTFSNPQSPFSNQTTTTTTNPQFVNQQQQSTATINPPFTNQPMNSTQFNQPSSTNSNSPFTQFSTQNTFSNPQQQPISTNNNSSPFSTISPFANPINPNNIVTTVITTLSTSDYARLHPEYYSSELTELDLHKFQGKFEFGNIPEVPPTAQLCL